MELIPEQGLSFAALRQEFDARVKQFFPPEESRAMLRFLYALEWPDLVFPRFADDQVPAAQAKRVMQIAVRLSHGEPLQYVLGKASFLDHVFDVGPGVLIPRPETEELYAWITEDYRERPEPVQITDIGCGSGCLAVSLAFRFPSTRVNAVDVSAVALDYTALNANRILGSNHLLQCLELDFLQDMERIPSTDLIVSNPPYIASDAVDEVDRHVQLHEPHLALYAPGRDALVFYRQLAELLKRQDYGQMYCEINPHYAAETCALFDGLSGVEVTLRKDLTGKDRMVRCIKKAP